MTATEALSEDWVAAIVEASAGREGRSGTVALTIGKTKRAVLAIVDGRVADGSAVAEDDVGVSVPLTAMQLTAIVAGDDSLAQAFMRGDVKPEGATGPFLAAVELFEDETFRQRLASLTT